ncbi:ABC transporter permease subunit [Bradyrhizobium sp. LHD-71]|uniref:ABC transporter permease n=1 Tax=Bradyrhizobium sp. LHD-71 TaxID=3072141 RepID=UPI00280C3FB7|nr:ABC transporter permease subunit [Bradyrhizobium sp. LHD-71]MDQ8731406.1 ABC transporter permease subunit [Bradyrhizobium sp. LHD-71]
MAVSPATLKGLVLPAALIATAEIGGRMADLQYSDSLATPSAIVVAFGQAVADGSILTTTRDTLVTAFAGLGIGGTVGLLIGILLGVLPTADRLMEVTIESIRPIPSIAVLPIALIALGFGYRLEIAIVAFACMWPLLILTRSAVRGVEPRLMEVSRALRLTPAARVVKIVIPAALPRIFVAFRLAAGIALIVSVTVEIAINPLGLGHAIMTAQQALRPELMLAYLVWLGVVGWGLNALLLFAQQRLFGRAAMVEERQ